MGSQWLTYHNAVGLPDCPKVDFLVVPTGYKNSTGLVTEGKAVHTCTVGYELLCKRKSQTSIYVGKDRDLYLATELATKGGKDLAPYLAALND